MLAEITGWSEHFLFWELRFARFEQYRHAALRAKNVWTVPFDEAPQPVQELSTDDQAALLFGNWTSGGAQ